MRSVEVTLVAHVGGAPTATQRILIGRAARLMLQLELMDRKTGGGDLSEREGRQALAWENTLRRTLQALGLERRAAAQPTLAELLSRGGRHGGEAPA